MKFEIGSLYRVRYKYDNEDESIFQCTGVLENAVKLVNVLTTSSSFIHIVDFYGYDFTYIGKLPTLTQLVKQHYPELFI